MIGYMCAYLRHYYPVEFIAAYLNNANNDDDIFAGTELAKLKGITIRPIKFRYSKGKYHPDPATNSIYKGLGSVKEISIAVSDELYELRDRKFDSFIDFLAVNPCKKNVTDILIRLNFFSEFGGSQKLLDMVEIFNKFYSKKIINKDKCNVPPEIMLLYTTETPKQYRMNNAEGLVRHLCDNLNDCDISVKETIEAQYEYLGYLDLICSEYKNCAYVLDVDTKYSPKIKLYQLDTGLTVVYKVSKSLYDKNPIKEQDIIQYLIEDREKCKKTETGWIKTGEKEWWIQNYTIQNDY